VSDSFRDLVAWQKAMVLATDVYRATDSFPARELYGLTNQVRRAAVAVPSDIAEGKGRLSKKEYVQMLYRARGSSFEVQTQLEISRNVGLLEPDTFADLSAKAAEVGRVINGLIRKVREDIRAFEKPKRYARPLRPKS
jgi:four helix bundle protein